MKPLTDDLLKLLGFALAGTLASGADPVDAVEDAIDAALIVKEELRKLNGSGAERAERARSRRKERDEEAEN